MNTVRNCGCKGKRSCLLCEKEYKISQPTLYAELRSCDAWSFCAACERIYPGWDTKHINSEHPQHNNVVGEILPGVIVKENFINFEEAERLTNALDSLPWTNSQSGRRKQNFGPKTNFKKRKLQLGSFCGFPITTEFVQQRFHEIDILDNYQTIEQCTLEYDPFKGAAIDPHIDDCWIWGERVVTVNCLGDAVLTMTVFNIEEATEKYNLHILNEYKQRLIMPLSGNKELQKYKEKVIRIPMPNLSLIVLYGPARYQFEHSILREDITERRVCIAYREFTPMYIDGNHQELGEVVTKAAKNFWNYELCDKAQNFQTDGEPVKAC